MDMKLDKATFAVVISIAGSIGSLSATVFAKSDRVAQLETRVQNVEEKVKEAKTDSVRELGQIHKKLETIEGDIKKLLEKK